MCPIVINLTAPLGIDNAPSIILRYAETSDNAHTPSSCSLEALSACSEAIKDLYILVRVHDKRLSSVTQNERTPGIDDIRFFFFPCLGQQVDVWIDDFQFIKRK